MIPLTMMELLRQTNFIRGKLERRILKLGNKTTKLRAVVAKQGEMMEQRTKEFDEVILL